MPEINAEEILKNVNAGLKAKKLYPAGHPSITLPVRKASALISDAIKVKNTFAIGLMNETIVLEETLIPETEKLYPEVFKFMTEKNVNAIIFEKGITDKELGVLFDILSGPLLQGSDLQKELYSKGVVHITLKSIPLGKKSIAEIYKGAVETVQNVMGEVRMGKIPRSEPVKAVVEELSESVFSDPNAMLGLTLIKNYDNYLYNHCVNVSILCLSLAKAMKLDKMEMHAIGVAGLLHDIGKTGVSEDIIRKPGGLSSEEWEKLKQHPVLGSSIVNRMTNMVEMVGRLVFEHHIRYDRSGYPTTKDTLHPFSQIITICDAYDALTTLRVYQQPHNPVEALKIMTNLSGRHFNPETLKSFVNMIGLYPVGTLIRLSTNQIGVVTKLNHATPFTPSIKIIFGEDGKAVYPPLEMDLSTSTGTANAIVSTVNPATLPINLAQFLENEAELSSAPA
ncbi:HD-GYP domain-containing protein [bacterium]|nr:MAG: HD-GYP domain-containing protein [bacterium]